MARLPGVWWALASALVGCQPSSPLAPSLPASSSTPRSSTPPEARSTPAASSASTTATASEPISPEPAARAPVTPGTIACGAETCDVAGQVCCLYSQQDQGRCLRRSTLIRTQVEPDGPALHWCPEVEELGPRDAPMYLACDDIGDCPAGQKCCNQAYDLGEGIYVDRYECAARCYLGEVCVGEGGCSRDSDCVVPDWSPGRGTCEYRSSVQCAKERCQGAQRWCCSGGGRHYCVGDDDECTGQRFQCLGSADCGPDTSCHRVEAPGGTQCGMFEYEPVVCASDADCPTEGPNAGPCVAQDDGPPGFGMCGVEP